MAEEEINILDYSRVLWKWRNLIIVLACVSIIITTAISLVLPYKWKAEATLLIPQKQSQGALASIVSGMSALPLDISSSILGRSTNFKDILESRTVTGKVIDMLDLGERFPEHKERWKLEKAIINNMLSVKEDKQGNIITVSVETKSPTLAAAMANAYLIALDDYNQANNLIAAKRTSAFIREQLAQAKVDLNLAEDKLKGFEVEATLVKIAEKELRRARLWRDVKIKEEIYTMLTAEYEKAMFEEERNASFFEVLDPADIPKKKSSPQTKLARSIKATC
ncbi:MAG: Wzz/FepE/Etk N-terminal domain-containing protein [Candidatus Saganbacteria bacterium]|nr:Wzz/FepE/Etk N-terminal domain-containing protein [Candidatus Saganbacteria bacterium]